MKNYLYELYHKVILYPFHKFQHYHRIISQIDDKNPFADFVEWFFDVLQYGFLAEFIRVAWFGYSNFLQSTIFLLSFGVIRWLWLAFVRETFESARNK